MVKKMVIHGLPDGAGPGDIVGALSNEAGIDGRLIGKISFVGEKALVEVDKRIYEKVVQIMDGNSIAGHQVRVSKETGLERVDKYVKSFTRLVQLEREEEMERFLYEVKKISGLERQKRGRALLHLQALGEEKRIEGGYLLTLSLGKGDSLPRTQIDVGDWVILNQESPLSGNRMLGMVAHIDDTHITLFFDLPLEEWFFQKDLRLDLYMDDAMFKDIYAVLKRLRSPETLSSGLCDILLDFAKPGSYTGSGASSFYDPWLTPIQREAVDQALKAEDLFLIKGGPGTGKTRTLKEIIRQLVDQEKTILVTSGSMRALEDLLWDLQKEGLACIGLGYPFQEGETLLSCIRKTPPFIEALKIEEEMASTGQESQDKTQEIQRLKELALKSLLERYPVVFCPANACGCDLLSSISFDLLIIDEATQIIEPLTIIPLLKVQKAIMAGDPNSLPPYLLNPRAREEGLAISLFERLLNLYGESLSFTFTLQYRMNGILNDFISQQFYQGELKSAGGITPDGLGIRKVPGQSPGSMAVNREEHLLFFDTSSMRALERSWCNYRFCENPVEADLVVEMISSFLYAGLDPQQLGVITPYIEHSNLIRKSLANPEIMVGMPIHFHGQEREIIIISLVRNNTKGWLGRLKDTRSMNLALSRSRKKTILVGSGETIGHHPFYQSLKEYIREYGFFYNL